MLSQFSQTMCGQEEGQILVEYLLLLSMLVVVVLVAFSIYAGPLGSIYTSIEEAFGSITTGMRF